MLAIALVYGALAAAIFKREGFRNASTVLVALGSCSSSARSRSSSPTPKANGGLAVTALGAGRSPPRGECGSGSPGPPRAPHAVVVFFGQVQPWLEEGELEHALAIASGACALAPFGLAALVWGEEARRDLRPWSGGRVVSSWRPSACCSTTGWTTVAVAATGARWARWRPLRETRLWLAGGASSPLVASVATIGELTPIERLFEASAHPADASGCSRLYRGARRRRVVGPRPAHRPALGAVAGGLALYAVSLGILGLAEAVSSTPRSRPTSSAATPL